MNEIVRRLIMMIGIVFVGTILIFFNTSVYITITAALAFGLIMAMALGLLKKEDFNRLKNLKMPSIKKVKAKKETKKQESKKETKKKESKQDKKITKSGPIFSRFRKKEQKNAPADEPKKTEKSRLSAGVSAALGSFNATVSKARDNRHSEKINSLLNSTIDEPLASSPGTGTDTPAPVLLDDTNMSSDEMDFFNDEDFASLDSLEIEGEEMSFDFDREQSTVSPAEKEQDSGLNLDDEINSILLAENAFDDDYDDTDLTPESASAPVSSKTEPKDADDQATRPEEGLFNSEEFFVQGIEDGLDEESFISLPDSFSESRIPAATLNDSLDELSSIKDFEKSNPEDDPFSDFNAINLDELETDDLSLETDEIIIEEEEINETDIFPDDYLPSKDSGEAKSGSDKDSEDNNFLLEDSGLNTPQIDAPISFSGKNEYDDILSVLKSDIKLTKKAPQASLVRDMKDVNVTAVDLAEELEIVLHAMGGKSRPINDLNDRSE
ncbi:hypothetical protein L1S32_03445 [Methanogenium sp. S4BF]|uniref:hypothetical protein n=1 Tax=Methanogenium sp. S4BF TaxID=1789226 RepID=UPI0024176E05|nr:hypothetical protein [Methanogenium sp. S4BF]WFN35185.1 hypothetical protein L1S32_03445 [Methanogenium sp. S4BF]